jgi:endoglycosylceramidase
VPRSTRLAAPPRLPSLALSALLALLVVLAGWAPERCAAPGVPPPPGEAVRGFRLPALHAEPDPLHGGRIADAYGREVLLRGVNVNAFVDYWAYDPARFTAHPFTEDDADAIAAMGWDAVRLLLSWSRVEPEPGVYDDAYLEEVASAVRLLEERGVYTLLDLHQDAWGPSLAAREDEACPPGVTPAIGWDGAPAWATLGGDLPRCEYGGIRELSPAVVRSFDLLWADAPGPGGVGILTRYARMLGHVVARFAGEDAVAGYDVMNEPNIIFTSGAPELTGLYIEVLAHIRRAEASVGAPRRLVFFEPSAVWSDLGTPALVPFTDDDQVVYAPHLYQGGIGPRPLSEAPFQQARDEAASLFGGAPVLSGEWGSDPRRAADPADDYFERHQALQDRYRIGATLWTWHEACGDPHKAGEVRAGQVPYVWGLFDVDCVANEVLGMRPALVRALRRAYVRAAPGPLAQTAWDPDARRLEAAGDAAPAGTSLVVFWPSEGGPPPRAELQGLEGLHFVPARGGHHFAVAFARGGAWRVVLQDPR